MQVKITTRWGSHPPGAHVEVDDVQGRWLVEHQYAEEIVTIPAPAPAPTSGGSMGTGKRPARHRKTGS